jgi:putative SOS response-associated peptidase YedK
VSSRYSLCAPADQLHDRFLVEVPPSYTPMYNAAPGQLLPVITNTGPRGISFFFWGLTPSWIKDKPISEKIIHIRAELIPDKTVYRKNLSQHRCLIPADGFYEWKKVGKKTAIPYRYTLQSKELFSFAGLWEEYEDNGEQFHTFRIITTPSDENFQLIDERMPVILNPEDEKTWLSNSCTEGEWLAVLRPFSSLKLEGYSISPRISSPAANDVGLIAHAPPSDQHGNLTLFD